MTKATNRIYKEKYMDEPVKPIVPFTKSPNPTMDGKSANADRSRSRARSIFSRKKSQVA